MFASEAEIEIVDRKSHVLLLAGGPMREYQFLRTLLFRDHFTTVDVLLQTAQDNISQEATKILNEFPSTREEMFDYDCVVAFDPDWQALTPAQVEVLHDWVDSQGGGLIVIAGPVNAGKGVNSWLQDPAMAKIRNLYPVEFMREFSAMDNFAYTAKEAWPLDFSREGLQADFLWLGEGPAQPGGVEGLLQACTASSRSAGRSRGPPCWPPSPIPAPHRPASSRPTSSSSSTVRGGCFTWAAAKCGDSAAMIPAYYEQFYTKLIRHVSQGRLLRGSARGTLMVGQDRYLLGNTVEVRARVTNARLQPLAAKSVTLEVIPPNGAVLSVPLAADQVAGRQLCRTIPGAAGGRLSPGIAGAGKRRRAAFRPHPGQGGRIGTREPAAQRHPVEAHRQR